MRIFAGTLNSVKAAQLLFFTNAAIWLLFGVISLIRITARTPDQPITAMVVAILMFGNVAAMLLSGIGIGWRKRLFYYFGVIVLIVNIILTFTDQFGALDFITLVMDVILLAILIATRAQYVTLIWGG